MDIKEEREAFEEWYENYKPVLLVENIVKGTARAAWQAAKAQAVPESRTDFEIIEQTIELVDLIAHANRFQRDKTKPLPFESENPRNIEWWRLACQIQELLTDTDPNNCDFEEYKAMIEA